ncbi:CHASE domain-containing protein [Methyloparacoccus murrellii]
MTILEQLRLAMAYVGLGAIGLMLAIAPGYASPIFPAAGLALAAVLNHGRSALPALWLGSFVLNLAHTVIHGVLDPASTWAAAIIALGSSMQAWSGSLLVRHGLGTAWRRLETERDTLRFLFFGGFLACTIAASINAPALLAIGIIHRAQFAFTWWNWYVGDLLGVLIFAPLTICFVCSRETLWRERCKKMAAPVILTLGLTALAFMGVARWEELIQRQNLESDGEKIAKHIADRLVTHREVLASLNHFIQARPDFTFQEFETFTRVTLRDNPDIFALSVNDLVPDGQRAAYERAMSELSPLGAFRITDRDSRKQPIPSAHRLFHVVVRYIVPLAGNHEAVGFDINSEPIRQDAIARAMASGRMAVTAPIRLVQEKQSRVGVLELDPILEHPLSGIRGVADVRRFAVSVVKVDQMLEIATRGLVPEGLSFRVTDAREAGPHGLLYRSAATGDAATPADVRHRDAPEWTTSLHMADREWLLTVAADEAYRQHQRPWLAWAVGVVGLLFTALLQILLLGMTGRAALIRQQNDILQASQAQRLLAEQKLQALNSRLEQRVAARTEALARKSTELAIAEERMRLALQASNGSLWDWNVTTGETYCNPAYYRMLGYDPQELGSGIQGHLVELLHPEDRERVFTLIRERLVSPGSFEVEFRLRDKGGHYHWMLSKGHTVDWDTRGRPVRAVGTHTDITERKAAELALQQSELRYRDLSNLLEKKVAERTEQLAEASAAKSTFLAHMSHELRTPMNAILGFAQILKHDLLTPDQVEMVTTIHEAGENLMTIINDILDLSKIESGQLRMERQEFTLTALLDRVQRLLRNMARVKGLGFHLRPPEQELGTLYGDPQRLQQVLINLAGNAIKFTERGSVQILVIAESAQGHSARVRFEVRDTGIGIAADVLARLFQPFNQGDASITRRFGGTGLGLVISKGLVEQMGGQMGVVSRLGQGSTFWFEIPFDRAVQEYPAAIRLVPKPRPPASGRLAGTRVLVVEDNLINQRLARRVLQQQGAIVGLAGNGQEALDTLTSQPHGFDIVLMDIQMPVMDGLTTAREIRKHDTLKDLPIIALSAGVLPEEREAAFRAGMDDFLAKPLDLDQLTEVLPRYCQSPAPGPEAAGARELT